MNKNKKLHLLLLIILSLSLLDIAAQFAPALYNRPIIDDLCTAGSAKDIPFIEYVKNDYLGWTGRYSYISFSGLAGLAGPRFAGVLPVLLVVFWFCGLIWSLFPIFTYLKLQPPLLFAAAVSSFYLAVLFNSQPSFFESLVWGAGSINYTMPLVLFTVVVGLLLRAWFDNNKQSLIPIVLFVFVIGGFSEIFGLLQIAVLASLSAYLILSKNRTSHKRFFVAVLAALFISVLAFGIVYAAPGNAVRQAASGHPQPTPLTQLPWLVLWSTLVEFYVFIIHARYWILPLFLVPFTFGIFQQNSLQELEPTQTKSNPKSILRSILWISLIVLGLAVIAALPSSYIQGDAPVSRAMILLFAFLVPAAGACSFLLGRLFAQIGRGNLPVDPKPRKWANLVLQSLALVSLFLGVTFSIREAIKLVPLQQQFAQAWDARDQELRALAAEGTQNAQAPMLVNAYGYSDLDNNPKHWINRCAARYYHLETITKSN